MAHRKRTEFARENGADLFVSIHADAFTSSKVSGASIYTLSGVALRVRWVDSG